MAEAVNQYVHKGDRLYVAGRLAQNSYETSDGQRRHNTEVHAAEVVFLDSRNGAKATADTTEAVPAGQAADSPF